MCLFLTAVTPLRVLPSLEPPLDIALAPSPHYLPLPKRRASVLAASAARDGLAQSPPATLDSTVSSANWLFLSSAPFIMIPLIVSSLLIARVRASTVRRKASGDSGHPCGTPLLIAKGKLLLPFVLMLCQSVYKCIMRLCPSGPPGLGPRCRGSVAVARVGGAFAIRHAGMPNGGVNRREE